MKKATLVLLCCSVFLYACDSSNDAVSDVNKNAASGIDSAKQSPSAASGAIDPAKEVSSAAAVAAKTGDVIAGAGVAEQGESIYKSKCVACHGAGAAGAPKLDDKTAWEARIAQGIETLTQHAIEGFKGDAGYMPPKGGYMSLSDNDISLVVKYMVSRAK